MARLPNARFAIAAILASAIAGCGSSAPSGSSSQASESVVSEIGASAAAPGAATTGSDSAAATAPTISMKPPVSAIPKDTVRGKGGLEEKCLARVGKETGSPVIGTNRIDESEASIDIYVNVQGAQAPWRCRGYRNGTIADVMYTGDEGAL